MSSSKRATHGLEYTTAQASKVTGLIFLTYQKKQQFLKAYAMSEESHKSDFYADCMRYFDSLRKQGKQDFAFEDEFFYTMPALSEKMMVSS